MIIYGIDTIREQELKPSSSDFSQLAFERDLLSEQERHQYILNQSDALIENTLANSMKEYGDFNWTLIRNAWLEYDEVVSCDMILISKYSIHLINVTHDADYFIDENGICVDDHSLLEGGAIEQTRKAVSTLQKICHSFNKNLTVNGTLLFSNVQNELNLHSSGDDLYKLRTTDIFAYIKEIKHAENSNPDQLINPRVIIDWLQSYEVTDPNLPTPMSPEKMEGAEDGFYCSLCRSNQLEHSASHVRCRCGRHESIEETIVRTACEYGVLTYNRDFSAENIHDFIGQYGSIEELNRILSKHFTHYDRNDQTYYKNSGQNYPYLFHSFQFDETPYYLSPDEWQNNSKIVKNEL